MTDLQARLRYRAELDFGKHDELNDDFSDTVEDTLAWQAADEIARLTEEVERLDGAIESPPKPMMDWIMEQSVKFAGCPRPSKLKHQTGRGLAKAILLLAGQYLRNEAALTDYQGDGK